MPSLFYRSPKPNGQQRRQTPTTVQASVRLGTPASHRSSHHPSHVQNTPPAPTLLTEPRKNAVVSTTSATDVFNARPSTQNDKARSFASLPACWTDAKQSAPTAKKPRLADCQKTDKLSDSNDKVSSVPNASTIRTHNPNARPILFGFPTAPRPVTRRRFANKCPIIPPATTQTSASVAVARVTRAQEQQMRAHLANSNSARAASLHSTKPKHPTVASIPSDGNATATVEVKRVELPANFQRYVNAPHGLADSVRITPISPFGCAKTYEVGSLREFLCKTHVKLKKATHATSLRAIETRLCEKQRDRKQLDLRVRASDIEWGHVAPRRAV